MKKIIYSKFLFLFRSLFLLFAGLSFCFISCIEKNNVENGENRPLNYEKYSDLYDSLSMTTWAYVGAEGLPTTSINKGKGHTVTFSSEISSVGLRLFSSFFSGYGTWFINEDGELQTDVVVADVSMNASDKGTFMAVFGLNGMITQLDNNSLVINSYGRNYYYKAAPYSQSGGSSGTGPEESTTYETPDIGLESFTCTTSSITVKYRVYNQDKAKVNSVKGYYGTSSPSKSVRGSISGSMITISITGLQKGTTYYIKCSATGPGGTTTSETTRLITNY